jgi:S1-C subfamily serine protease
MKDKTMKAIEHRLYRLLRILLVGCLAVAIPVAFAQEVDLKELKQQIEEARADLDKAATRLAELNMKKFGVEVSGERSSRPMLGVLVEDHDNGDGIRLVGVTPNMGAAEANLKAGDLLVALNGYRLDTGESSMEALGDAMDTVIAGEIVAVEFLRDELTQIVDVTTEERGAFAMKMGKSLDLDIDLGDLEQLKKLEALGVLAQLGGSADLEQLEMLGQPGSMAAVSGFGAVKLGDVTKLEDVSGDLATYFGVDQGVVVMSVPDDSVLKAGDVLLALAGEPVTSAQSAAATLRHSETELIASVLRDRSTIELSLVAGTPVFSSSGVLPGGSGSISIHIDHDEMDQDSRKHSSDDDG